MNFSFFQLSKIFWMIFSPDILLVFLFLLACLLLWIKAYKKALMLFNILGIIMLMITFFPVGDWLFYPLEKRFVLPENISEPIDGIVMLGGSENILGSAAWDQVELIDGAERYLAFIHLIKKYPDVKHVYSGGTGNPDRQDLKGARIAKRLLDEQGMNTSNIIFESESKNTYENALFTHRILKPSMQEKWILITSAAHMPRSFGIFSKLGWQIIPYPVDHRCNRANLFRVTTNFSGNLNQLRSALHEWTGLAAYYLSGKTDCFFPGQSRQHK